MIVIRFGRWCHKATKLFTYDRIYYSGVKPTILCIKKFRYVSGRNTNDSITFDNIEK